MDLIRCPNCNSNNVGEVLKAEAFQYGINPPTILTPEPTPHYDCADCGTEWTDYLTELARHAAVGKLLKGN